MTPYEQPVSIPDSLFFHLDPALVNWAYQLTKDIKLEDTPGMKAHRDLYVGYPNALKPPSVGRGDHLSSSTFWHGALMNKWANDWVSYFTGGKGNYVTTAMEDSATLYALSRLGLADRVDPKRALVLRSASNFDMQWPGATAIESLSGEKLGPGYSAYIPSLENLHTVGSRVMHALLDGWDKYAETPPGG